MKAKSKEYRYSKKARLWAKIGSAVMAVLGVLCLTAAIVLTSVLGRINFQGDTSYDPNAEVDLGEDTGEFGGEVIDPNAYNGAADVSALPIRGNEKGIRNILLLGIDGKSYSGRSDTTIILSINDNDKTIKLVSLLRDTWVSIPGRDKDGDGKDDIGKFNAAYAYGKHSLQDKTIEKNFRLDINEYIGVNFESLPKVVDAMGGLDLYLTAKEASQVPGDACTTTVPTPGRTDCDGINGYYAIGHTAGTYHLNGFQAMQYARIRKLDSDFKRTARQREVVNAMIAKAKTMSYSKLVSVLYKALECVDTNMSSDEFLGFAASAVKYMGYTVEMDYSVPQTGNTAEYKGATINGGSGLLLTDPKTTVTNLHKYLYG